MTRAPDTEPTTGYWQALLADWPDGVTPQPPYRMGYPVRLPDGRVLALPDGLNAVASLIANQASFAVIDALATAMTELARASSAEVIVGMPTLGLSFASLLAERLGHTRYAPLGYSRKFWYEETLSVPVSSVTSPDGAKRLYLDPNLVPLLRGRRVCLVDDAVSGGTSALAGWRLLAGAGIELAAVVVAMKQTMRWHAALGAANATLPGRVRAVFGCPLFARGPHGGWVPVEGTLPHVP